MISFFIRIRYVSLEPWTRLVPFWFPLALFRTFCASLIIFCHLQSWVTESNSAQSAASLLPNLPSHYALLLLYCSTSRQIMSVPLADVTMTNSSRPAFSPLDINQFPFFSKWYSFPLCFVSKSTSFLSNSFLFYLLLNQISSISQNATFQCVPTTFIVIRFYFLLLFNTPHKHFYHSLLCYSSTNWCKFLNSPQNNLPLFVC